ncbi:uncharacterized protein LOC121733699 [Aricia agestis]|uniref:uncharacterized protein LOC121733699 n=1 Tax=Aricia agestis TaxID=91739 RepID=UPI001C2068D1|nr:uncharacterized protein LOC121733699 [Aricia agestis]
MHVFNILIATALFISANAFSADNIEKCSLKDDECLKRSFKNTLKSIGKTGVPELGIPSIDPVAVKNFHVTVLDSIDLNFKEGVVKGIKNCEFKKYSIDLDKKIGTTKIACDLTIKGHFDISGSSPALQGLIGRDSIKGEGNAKVKLEKLTLEFTVPLKLEKHDDGKLYLQYPGDKLKYKYTVDKMTFAADKIFIGKEDISGFVVTYLNQNWKSLMQNFGKTFMDKALEQYSDFAKNLFNKISIDKIITDDLSAYAN